MKAQPLQVRANKKLQYLFERKRKAEALPVAELRKWADEYNAVIKGITDELSAMSPQADPVMEPYVEGLGLAFDNALSLVDAGMPAREGSVPGQTVRDYLDALDQWPDLRRAIVDAEIYMVIARIGRDRNEITAAIRRLAQAWTDTAAWYVRTGGNPPQGFTVATDEECPA